MAQNPSGNTSIKKIERLAKKGDKEAEYLMGYYYYNGEQVEKNTKLSCIYFKRAASHGHKYAKAWLSHLCDEEKNYNEAYSWAMDYIDNPVTDGTDVARWWLRSCSYLIGKYKYNGFGTNIDKDGAIKYYEIAKENGLNTANWGLYNCYYEKDDMKKSFYYAKEIYTSEGYPLTVAQHYLYGWGCNQDLGKVRDLLQELANGKLRYNAQDGSVSTVPRNAIYVAKCYIGIANYFDKNKKNHYEEAVRWLTMVVESEEASDKAKGEAMCILSRCYRFGRGVSRNIGKANMLEREAKKLIEEKEYDKVSSRFRASY